MPDDSKPQNSKPQAQRAALRIMRFLAVAVGALQWYLLNGSIGGEDTVSYLDLADSFARFDLNHAVSSYWSPLYPIYETIWLHLVPHTMQTELQVIHLCTFLTYVFAVFCFDFCLQQMLQYRFDQNAEGQFSIGPVWFSAILYVFFTCFSLSVNTSINEGPDFLMDGLYFLAVGLLLRIIKNCRARDLYMLAIFLALGYLDKAIMLPVSAAFLLAIWWRFPTSEIMRKDAAKAILIWAAITLPFVIFLSLKQGYLTFGDSGKLNYAWLVQRDVPFSEPIRSGMSFAGCRNLKHPPRIIFDQPDIFLFDSSAPCTMPVWFDPIYWYSGFKLKFDGLSQFVATFASIFSFIRLFFGLTLVGWVILMLVSLNPCVSRKSIGQNMPLLVVALFPLTLYSVAINCNIYNVARLFSPFFVVSLSAFLTCLRLPSARSRLTLLVVSCLELTYYAYNFQPGLRGCLDNPPMKAEQNIASTLAQLNIGPGSPVAEVDPLRKYYWARIAKVKVISEVLDYQGFLDNYEKHKTEILSSWAQAGVKAVVLRLPDAGQLDKIPKDWIRVSNDTDFILVIPHLIQSRSQGVKDD